MPFLLNKVLSNIYQNAYFEVFAIMKITIHKKKIKTYVLSGGEHMSQLLIYWGDLGLLVYSMLKAFLPLPSLEVILFPLVIANPTKWLLYTIEGAIGTFIGATIGYYIAYFLGKQAVRHIAIEKDLQKGEALIDKYGVFAIFIGGITPLPDFLLAYLAGFVKMSYWKFVLSDSFARLIRSFIIIRVLLSCNMFIDFDTYGVTLSYFILLFFLLKWIYQKYKAFRIKSQK